jgi:MFS family permease
VSQDLSETGVLSRQLVLSLYLPAAMLALGESLVTPIIPLFTKQFGVGFATASLVFVMMNVGGLVAAFSTGYLMDTIGRRPVLLAGPLLMAVGSLMTPFAGSFPALLWWGPPTRPGSRRAWPSSPIRPSTGSGPGSCNG